MSGNTVVRIDCDCLEIYARFSPKPGNPDHKGVLVQRAQFKIELLWKRTQSEASEPEEKCCWRLMICSVTSQVYSIPALSPQRAEQSDAAFKCCQTNR